MGELRENGPGRLTFELSEDQDGAMVKLHGELDMATAGKLDSAVAPLISKSPKQLVIDVGDLEFADSSAIALMVRWANIVPHVEIRRPSQLLRDVIARMGLSDRLHVIP